MLVLTSVRLLHKKPLRNKKFRYLVKLYGKVQEVYAYNQIFLLKTLRCPEWVVLVFRKIQWVAMQASCLSSLRI